MLKQLVRITQLQSCFERVKTNIKTTKSFEVLYILIFTMLNVSQEGNIF